MNLSALFELKDAEVKALKKEELVKIIIDGRYVFNTMTEKRNELEKEIKDRGKAWNTVTIMLAAYLGKQVKKDWSDYLVHDDGEKRVDLLELVGEVLALKSNKVVS